MAASTNSFIQFLDEPLPKFKKKSPDSLRTEESGRDYLTVPDQRKDTTSQWRSNTLKNAALELNMLDFAKYCAAFREATFRFSKKWTPPELYKILSCLFPRHEDDTS